MSELIYANTNNKYGYIYDDNGDKTEKPDDLFPEVDAVVYKMEYNKLQLCWISKHRFVKRPSSFFQSFFEKTDRAFFRDSFSAVFDLQIIDEKYFNALAAGKDISRFRRQGRVRSLVDIGSPLLLNPVLDRQTLADILHAVFYMLTDPGEGKKSVEIGLPYGEITPDMDYDEYAGYRAGFDKAWKAVLKCVYVYLPYLLRRKVGFTVNASKPYSQREIRIIPLPREENPRARLLNPPPEMDPACMELVHYLLKAKDDSDLTRRLDELKESVEDRLLDSSIDRITSTVYIKVLGEKLRLESMDDHDLMQELYDEYFKVHQQNKGDEAYVDRLKQYIGKTQTERAADQWIVSCIESDERFDKYFKYTSAFVMICRLPFPDYRIPYDLLLTRIDRYAENHVFCEDHTPMQVKEDYDRLVDLLDRSIASEDCLSLYRCAKALLEERQNDYLEDCRKKQEKQQERIRLEAQDKLENDEIPWEQLENWLQAYGGEKAHPETKELKSRRILEGIADMTLDPAEAGQIISRCSNCLDSETVGILTALLQFASSPGQELTADLRRIEGKTDALGLGLSGPSDYLVKVLSHRYDAKDISDSVRQLSQQGDGAIFYLDTIKDYNLKKIFGKTLLAVLSAGDRLEFEIPSGCLDGYAAFFRTICSAGEDIAMKPAVIRFESGRSYADAAFDRFSDVIDVIRFMTGNRVNPEDETAAGYLLREPEPDPDMPGLVDYMIWERLLNREKFTILSDRFLSMPPAKDHRSIFQSRVLKKAFTELGSMEYPEDLRLTELRRIVEQNNITTEIVGKLYPAQSPDHPLESLTTLAKRQDEKPDNRNKEKASSHGDAESKGWDSGDAESKGWDSGDAESKGWDSGDVESKGRKSGGRESGGIKVRRDKAKKNEEKGKIKLSERYQDILLNSIAGLLLVFGVVGIIFAYFNRNTEWVFWPLTVLSSLFIGGACTWFLNIFLSSDEKKSDRNNSDSMDLISLVIGAFIAVIVLVVAILVGTGIGEKKRTEEPLTAEAFFSQISASHRLEEGRYTISSGNGSYFCLDPQNNKTFITIGNNPYTFYIKPSVDGLSYVLFTDEEMTQAVDIYQTNPFGKQLYVETYDEGDESMRFYLKWLKDDLYQFGFVYNKHLLTVNDSGEITTMPESGTPVFWHIRSADASSGSQGDSTRKTTSTRHAGTGAALPDGYELNKGFSYEGQCTLSTTIGGVRYYIACPFDKKSPAFLTEEARQAVLHMEKDKIGNLYFIAVGADGTKWRLCFGGDEAKDGAAIKFGTSTNDSTFKWSDMEEGMILCGTKSSLCIYAANDLTLSLKKVDENMPAQWTINKKSQ